MLGSLAAAISCWLTAPTTSDALRKTSPQRGAWANVKLMPNSKNVPPFNRLLYRNTNLVERFFNKIKHFRAIATRYDKRPKTILAGVKLASLRHLDAV